MIGETVSHYSILEKLGEGGMGVVYKATDQTLERTVALKFLPPHLAASEQDKARFRQEAKAAAALNHQNVCSIIEIGEHEGNTFIVMEYIEGQTLRSKLSSLGLRQAIDTGIQIADGLAAAHEKGIVHRDVKPENVMLRKDGVAIIMDFGLAKLRTAASSVNRLTKEGSTVGTAGYMSPEQVQGQDTDHRSDIFSLGVVLYELFTGSLPFRGAHEMALAYEIVNVDPPPLSVIKSDVDPELDRIVLECLHKDPPERFQSASEISKELKRFKRESSRQRMSRVTAARPIPATDTRSRSSMTSVATALPEPVESSGTARTVSRLPWIIASVSVLVALAVLVWRIVIPPTVGEISPIKAFVLSPPGQTFDNSIGGHIAISPDGKTIAFTASDSTGNLHLFVRPVNSTTANLLAGSDDAHYPFWSPDSRKLGFFSQNKLKTVEITGGPILTVCDATDGRGGTWNTDNVIVFAPNPISCLMKVNAVGGTPSPVTVIDTLHHEGSHRWPWFFPDDDHFLYTTQSGTGIGLTTDGIRIGSLKGPLVGGGDSILLQGFSNVEYSNGRILYIRQGALVAQPFDPSERITTGDPVPLSEQLLFAPAYSKGSFSVSQNGVLIQQTSEQVNAQVGVYSVKGELLHAIPDPSPGGPRLSFDGKFLAYQRLDPAARRADIWTYDLGRGVPSRLTFGTALDIGPVWSPSGDSIVFQSNRGGVYDLFMKSSNGSGPDVPFLQSNRNKSVCDWSSDGKFILYLSGGDPKTKTDIWILPMTGDRTPRPFIATDYNETWGTFSPDHTWIAYQSDESGRNEVYIRRFDGTGGKIPVTINGGRRPMWKADPVRLYFASLDRKAMVAILRVTSTAVTVERIEQLFDFESRNITGQSFNDVSSDGKSFAAVSAISKLATAPITLIVNWDADLHKK